MSWEYSALNWQFSPYAIVLIVAALITTIVGLVVFWRQRHRSSSTTGMVILLAASLWMLGSALELASVELAVKLFWDKMQFVGICVVPTGWLVYAVQYIGNEEWVTPRNLVLASLVPCVTLFLVSTNEAHGLIWSKYWLQMEGVFATKGIVYGFAFWAFLLYSYAEIFLGLLLLSQALVRSGQLYRWQAIVLLLGVTSLAAVYLFLDLLVPDRPWTVEWTPLAIGIAIPLVAWSLYRLRRRDIVPVARDIVLEEMGDAIVVLDKEGHIIDLNAASLELIGRTRSDVLGQHIEGVWSAWPGSLEPQADGELSQEVLLKRKGKPHYYDMRISTLSDWRGRPTSYVIVLRDISWRKRAENEREQLLQMERQMREKLAVIHALGRRLVLSRDSKQIGHAVMVAAKKVLNLHMMGLYLFEEESQDLVCHAATTAKFPVKVERLSAQSEKGIIPAVFRTGAPVYLPDVRANPRYLDAGINSLSEMCVPLKVEGKTIGVLNAESENADAFDEMDLQLFSALADYCALALENARLYGQAKHHTAQLQASLEEKEVLLKEIHHRVKNNLQVVSSLLSLQSEQIQDGRTWEMFVDSQARIRSMALVHEKLYQSAELARVNFGEYVRSLGAYLLRSYGEKADTVTITVDIAGTTLDIDMAITCGLITNELVSNALKHAFPLGQGGQIRIAFSQDQGRLVLIVEDNGIGFPTHIDFRNTESLGLQLVITLVEQLEGWIELDRTVGTTFRVVFSES
jgi:PAS domain S-box-containing protein